MTNDELTPHQREILDDLVDRALLDVAPKCRSKTLREAEGLFFTTLRRRFHYLRHELACGRGPANVGPDFLKGAFPTRRGIAAFLQSNSPTARYIMNRAQSQSAQTLLGLPVEHKPDMDEMDDQALVLYAKSLLDQAEELTTRTTKITNAVREALDSFTTAITR